MHSSGCIVLSVQQYILEDDFEDNFLILQLANSKENIDYSIIKNEKSFSGYAYSYLSIASGLEKFYFYFFTFIE